MLQSQQWQGKKVTAASYGSAYSVRLFEVGVLSTCNM